ncbi:MAG: DUF2189 domain-containing protein [Filomicrobium sp.]
MAAATQAEKDALPSDFVVDSVAFDAPWAWLAAGWRDLTETPKLSLGYGAVFAAISLALVYGLFQAGWQSVIVALSGGFLILGPLLAIGLYEISRRRAANEELSLDKIAWVKAASPLQLAYMGFVLLFIFSSWLRIAFLLFAIFFGDATLPAAEQFIPELLFTTHGLGLLIVGTIVGGVLAFFAFSVSAISVPLLVYHRVDFLTAMTVSVRAVAKNLHAMLLWAALIAGIMACGIATMFIGLVVAFPLVGHATWHAYAELVRRADE